MSASHISEEKNQSFTIKKPDTKDKTEKASNTQKSGGGETDESQNSFTQEYNTKED